MSALPPPPPPVPPQQQQQQQQQSVQQSMRDAFAAIETQATQRKAKVRRHARTQMAMRARVEENTPLDGNCTIPPTDETASSLVDEKRPMPTIADAMATLAAQRDARKRALTEHKETAANAQEKALTARRRPLSSTAVERRPR